MLSIEQLSQMVHAHLGLNGNANEAQYTAKWIIKESPLGGRGLFATEDLVSGEVLFVDHPLIAGPRSGTLIRRGCTVCCKLNKNKFFKCDKCSLLLCSESCQNSSVHNDDCGIISGWRNKVSIEEVDAALLSRALTAIRALLLNEEQKRFMISLQAHVLPQHGTEIQELQQYFEIPEHDVQLMILTSCVLDANAFQIATSYGKEEMGKRGLYPVSSLLNHNCVPNTRYNYNSDLQMIVKTVKPIKAGCEIFTCYTGLLWGTPARRIHLYKTKHFLCKCERCADPTERGTFLAALKCFSAECPGSLLPIEPLKSSSSWRCFECGLRVPSDNICTLQSALGSLIGSLDFGNIIELENFYLCRVTKYIPKSNQIVVDLQCRLIWELGEIENHRWHELSEYRLSLKEQLCRDTLRTAAALGAGDAHLRGLLLFHLHAALAERARRCPDLYDELKSEIEAIIDQAYTILQGDISAPPDLELRHRYLGPGSDKPQEERFFILDTSENLSVSMK
ncbi:PREDICTED: protein msta, isoform B-like [Papilio polytes]|uniref:protein msta, isoform B-like n=1 Tax=Papilio polytes TaxID=76194 RepID=UPI00067650EE|nr:PREDICTED: protein msta, isoform B-like [Papilio polytes]